MVRKREKKSDDQWSFALLRMTAFFGSG